MPLRRVVFVAPFLMHATTRFVHAVAALPDVRLALVTQDGPEALEPALGARLDAYVRAEDALDAARLLEAVRTAAARLGGVDRLLGTLEQLQVPLAVVRQHLGIEGLGVEAAENFRDKARMKNVLRAAGVPCARHRLATSPEEAVQFVREVGFPVVAKPPAGAGAKATWRLAGEADLRSLLEHHRPGPGESVLLEEFMSGQEHSFDTVTIRGHHVWHSLSHYDPTPLHVLENKWIQWCVLVPREIDHPRYDDIRRVATKALDALGMWTGVSHMEWFRRQDGSVAVSEVAARPPGAQFCTLISYAHDIDFYQAWARVVVFDAFDAPPRRYAAGAAYLRGQGEGRVRAVHGLEQAQKELGPLVVEAKLPQQGQGPSGSYEGEGYVILRHPETQVVERALRRLVSLVRVEMA
jgi:biotin carboxylase